MRIALAFRAFFLVLFRKDAAEAVRAALAGLQAPSGPSLPPQERAPGVPKAAPAKPDESPAPTPAGRSDALTLLSTLQREARLLDLVGEPLDGFEDAQVGAAARQVLADVRKVLDRMFAIKPLMTEDEGSKIPIPKPASPVRYHVVGSNAEQAERGTLVHRGWKAERCQTPTWNGSRDDALILSPAEIEV
jgi:hypothetical protein